MKKFLVVVSRLVVMSRVRLQFVSRFRSSHIEIVSASLFLLTENTVVVFIEDRLVDRSLPWSFGAHCPCLALYSSMARSIVSWVISWGGFLFARYIILWRRTSSAGPMSFCLITLCLWASLLVLICRILKGWVEGWVNYPMKSLGWVGWVVECCLPYPYLDKGLFPWRWQGVLKHSTLV